MQRLFPTHLLLLVVALLSAARLITAADSPPHGEAIRAAIEPFVEKHALAGAVLLVADKDRILSLDALGYADLAARRPMQSDTLFWIASQSKSITAAALMMLVDEGKVALDDPVVKFLPEFRDEWLAAEVDQKHELLVRPKHPITVREVLCHASGLPFKSALETPTLDMLPLSVAVGSYAMTPLMFEPGSTSKYSNAGINTAGRIIEVVSQMPYEKFLQARLFDPLGMKDTTFVPTAEQLERLAKSYKPNAAKDNLEEVQIGQLHYPLDDPRRQPMPAGGLFSTARDVARFCQMMLGGGVFEGKRLLSEGAVRQMTTKQTPESDRTQYGLGLGLGGGSFGHGGANATNMNINPQLGLITVYMVQCTGGFIADGKEAQGVFRKTAEQTFAQPARQQ